MRRDRRSAILMAADGAEWERVGTRVDADAPSKVVVVVVVVEEERAAPLINFALVVVAVARGVCRIRPSRRVARLVFVARVL